MGGFWVGGLFIWGAFGWGAFGWGAYGWGASGGGLMGVNLKKAIRGNTKLCKEVYFLTEFATLEVSLSLRNLSGTQKYFSKHL